MTEYRASFDASISFSNGGDLAVHGFRVDVGRLSAPGR
jgi:arylformamidase